MSLRSPGVLARYATDSCIQKQVRDLRTQYENIVNIYLIEKD